MKKHSYRAVKGQMGVTLIELVLVILILSIAAVAMSTFLSSSTKAYNTVEKSTDGYNKLTYSMSRLSNEIKTADYDSAVPGFIINGNYSATHFEFDNIDGITVVLNYASNKLTLSYSSLAGGTAYTLVDNVSAFSFTYYKSNGVDTPADETEIEFVEFDLTIVIDNVNYHSKSRVALRNL